MSRKPVAPVPNLEGVSNGAPGEAVSGPSTGRPSGAARQWLALDLVCSYCGAKPGEWCRDKKGKSGALHDSRTEKANKLNLRWRAWYGDHAANAEAPPL